MRGRVPLRRRAREARLIEMDARILVPLLAAERARYVKSARRRLPTEADAEDVVQKALMRAAERAGSLEDPARLRPWFARIVRRGVVDFFRSQRPMETCDAADLPLEAEVEVAPRRLCPCSLRLVDGLRPAYAEVIRRVDVEGEPMESVALALGITAGTLHVRVHRARRALRDRVMRHCGVASCGPCLDCTCSAHERCGRRPAA
jgi:RNA polymerase sigma-70 factor (ECF subfamily)